MSCRRLPPVFCLLFSAFCILPSAFGQSATATLSGTVTDQNDAVVPGIAITVLNLSTALRRQAMTSEQGYFTVPLLPPGTYSVKAQGTGFTPIEIPNVVLNVGDQKALQIQLKAGDITEMVQVLSEAPLINESPAIATTVDRQFVGNLPLNGRSFQSLITLSPGVVLTQTSSSEAGQFSVNGQRANANYFTVDGVSANISSSPDVLIGQSGSGALPGFTASGGTNNLVSVDALQEFKIQTSTYAPEFGRQPGGQISILTRSGTNDFHGTLFDYVRNDIFDANDWFANSSRLSKPPLRQNDFGGTLGGPVMLPKFGEGGRQPWYEGRNRTFFFLSYEGLRLRQPNVGIRAVPSVEVRQIAPAGLQPFLNAFPRPTGPARANGFADFAASFSNPATLDASSVRIDHTVSERLTLFGRYNYAPSNTVQRINALNTLQIQKSNTQTVTVGATLGFSTRVSNELRANYSRLEAGTSFGLDEFGGAVVPPDSLLFPAGFTRQDSLYVFVLLGGRNIQAGTNVSQLQRQVNLVDNLSVVTGNHQLKFGVDYRRLSPVYGPRKYNQVIIFNGLGVTAAGVPPPVGSVLSGRLLTGQIAAQAGSRPIFTNLSFYGQDTWRVVRRLNLTYGLRWEVNPASRESGGNNPFTIIGIDNPITAKLGPRGRLYDTTYTNFAPRFGLAYQLSQLSGHETVIRGGVGIFYDLGSGSIANAYGGFPFTSIKGLPGGTVYPLESALAAPAPFSLTPSNAALVGADPDLKLPRVYQWNVAVEQSLGRNQTLTASYVAALGRRLLRQERIFLAAGLNPNFSGTLIVTNNAATSDYHAMQLQFNRRLSRGLQALASYTWSHSLDIASNDASQLPPEGRYDPRQDRGPSNFDVRQAFNAAITYDLPKIDTGKIVRTILGGWSIDTIFTARAATPVDITSSRTIGFDSFSLRPDLVPGVPLYLNDPGAPGGRRFNRAAFVIPTAARQGTLGRNALRGFPVWQLDAALRRQFNVTERLKLQLRAEAFNLFNHPNFGDPNGSLTSSSFGLSTSMFGRSLGSFGTGLNTLYQVGGPRSMQLSVRLNF
ncbi:MAG TPA: TonB-dependent receptor [Pyrinomonadaceae bacterium]|nr:TonB-dependent receptor [Pyrinomonadaceae bacterium]